MILIWYHIVMNVNWTLVVGLIGVALTAWIVWEMVRQKLKADVIIGTQILAFNDHRVSGMNQYLHIENRGVKAGAKV